MLELFRYILIMEKDLAQKGIKRIFDIAVEKSLEKDFRLFNLKANLSRGKMMAAVTIAVEVIIILVSFLFKRGVQTQADKYYYFMYILFVVVVSILLLIMIRMERNPRLGHASRSLAYGFVLFVLSWNMVISVLDGQITSYVIALLAISIIAIIRPAPLLVLYFIVHTSYCLLTYFFEDSSSVIFSSCVNSTIAVIVSWMAAYILYNNRAASFSSQKELENKKAELEKVNAELNKANKKLEYLSQTDGLTGIYNRRMFDTVSNGFWEDCMREHDFLTVIMIDIDHFKIFNDTYGHQKGDDCLIDIVSAIKSIIPEDSMLARYGGEEFAVLVKNITQDNSFNLAEKIRGKITELNIGHVNSPVRPYVTLSLGVFCGTPSETLSVTEFISFADKALYKAKNGGRDMTVNAGCKCAPVLEFVNSESTSN